MARSNMLSCKGLVTYTSETASPEGALVVADNVNVDEPNVITPRRGFDDFLDQLDVLDDTKRIKQVLTYKDKLIRHWDDKLEYETPSQFEQFDGSYEELETGLRIKAKESNSNLYFTTSDGIKKISALTSDEFTTSSNYITNAGVPKATDLTSRIVPEVGGFLVPKSKAAYRCLFGYTDVNSNLLLGTPSSREIVTNSSQNISVNEENEITVTGTTISPSDYILVSSTTTNYYVWFDTTGSSSPPVTSSTVGRTAVKISLFGYLTSSNQIAAKIAQDFNLQTTEFSVTANGAVVTIENNVGGDVSNIATGSSGVFSSNLTVSTAVSGLIVEASPSNVLIRAVIPQGITTNHFFQLYRSSIIEAGDIDLDLISPDDELQLVYETPITSNDILNGYIEVTDSTPETFRASALPLYTNAQTGETILQSNDVPPVAKDLESFRGSMFYSNTKKFHTSDLTMISVDDYISGSTQFYIGDSSGISSYTFRGIREIFDLTVAEQSRTVGGSYVNLYSANNLVEYYMWFYKGAFSLSFNSTTDVNAGTDEITVTSHGLETGDKVTASGTLPTGLLSGTEYYVIRVDANTIQLSLTNGGPAINISTAVGTGTLTHEAIDPAVANKVGIRVDLSLYPDTVQGTRDAIKDNLQEIADFTLVDSVAPSDITFTVSYNGDANEPTFSNPSPGSLWALSVSQEGRGETRRGSFSALSVANPMVVTASNHGLETGDSVILTPSVLIAAQGTYLVTYINKDSFSVAYDNSLGSTDTGTYREESNWVYLSDYPSISLAITETARSLVRVINFNSLSAVNGFYVSGTDDLPGKMTFERKNLLDIPFYLAISDSNLSGEFTPELPVIVDVSTITFSAGVGSNAKITTASPHGLITGTDIYISSPDTTPAFAGKYKITVTSSTQFTVPVVITAEDTPSTNSFFYKATVSSNNATTINRLYFSKYNQPESVPNTNYIDIGPKDKAILRILSLRDNLFVMKEDGIYIVSGQLAPNFNVRLLDRNAVLTAPDTAVALNNQIFALADQGIVGITESGAPIVSRLIEDKIKAVANPKFNFKSLAFGVGYETDRSYLIWLPTKLADEVATQCYRYNLFEQTWTRWTVSATCGLVKEVDDKMYLGSGDRSYIYQERKTNDRTDHADRSLARNITQSGYNSTTQTIVVSSVADLDVGDVIVQNQTVTISIYNRLLRKLDYDAGLNDNDYEDTLKMELGDNLSTKLNALNSKLFADIGLPIDNARIFTNDFTTMRTLFNDLIDELNDVTSSTQYKNYQKLLTDEDYPTPYEAIILEIKKNLNQVTINYPVAFVEGFIVVYKGIKASIQWAPLHYGDPMAFKQVNTIECIFDQNNFYSASLSIGSDLSQAFVEVPFLGKGVGFWGYGTWGDQNLYWGGNGNDVPFRDIVPQEKQRCRYLNVKFSHINAREYWRILGISSNVRAYSDRAYRSVKSGSM